MKTSLTSFLVFFKYALVGILGTCIDMGFLFLFVEYVKIPILLATTLSFVLAVINNFLLNKYWTFENKHSNIRKQFIKFFIVALLGLCLTLGLMYFFVYVVNIPSLPIGPVVIKGYLFAKAITSCIVLIWNFLGSKYWSFKDTIRVVHHLEKYVHDISIIIPAFNEENRIIPTLETIDHYFLIKKWSYQIIVVDDGSTDQTIPIVEQFISTHPSTSLVQYDTNRGKGYAVKKGIEASMGKYVLFTDADHSTPITEFDKLYPLLSTIEVVIGSRYIKGSNIKIKQPWYRILIGRLGNMLIQWFLIDGIQDTQCGFKAMQHEAAKEIFARMKIERFGFDMELLAIAKLLKYTITEVGVSWINSTDSRVRPIKDGLRTLKELMYIKLNLWGGRYL